MKSIERCLCFTLIFLVIPLLGRSQDYVLYRSGDTADVITMVRPGFVLAGGGSDNDEAMKWMLNRAAGGDVLVLRASGSDGYNPYFYNELGAGVNSVETVVFRNRNASYDPYILRRISEAEVIWFAGGDQGKYYDFWAGTPTGDLLATIAESGKRIMGGTSAGMMILGGIIYAPTGTGVISGEALADPYHFHMSELRYNTFMRTPAFINMVFDTHFDQRDRAGRTVAFMARASKDAGIRARAITCNEHTAVCIDENNQVRVYGDPASGKDFAYFLEANCGEIWQPQKVEAGKPLTWTAPNGHAVVVQVISGTKEDTIRFDLNEWKAGAGTQIMHWQVQNGILEKKTTLTSDCRPETSGLGDAFGNFKLYPNPGQNILFFDHADQAVLGTPIGRQVAACEDCSSLQGLERLPCGWYVLRLTKQGFVGVKMVMLMD